MGESERTEACLDALLRRLHHDTGASITIGLGRYHPGIRGLSRSYEDARAALTLGGRLHGTNRVHCLDSLGVAAFVGIADERTKMDLATHLLSPLDQEPELLETLDAFLENCSMSSTAARLCIHRNTLSYRLDKTASLTGLDARVFAEQLAALVRPGDVVVAISASGNSPNVLAAVELARLLGAISIALTGETGGQVRKLAHLTVRVPARPIEQVEDVHMMMAHSLCVAIRERLRAARPMRVDTKAQQIALPVGSGSIARESGVEPAAAEQPLELADGKFAAM